RTLHRLDSDRGAAEDVLEVIARRDRARRTGGGDERAQAQRPALVQRAEDSPDRRTRATIVHEVVRVLGELVEDDVGVVEGEPITGVVDLLHVRLGAGRAHDVVRLRPRLEPAETLRAHSGWQHGHAAAADDARDGHAAAAVVAGRRPDGAVSREVEFAAGDAR